MSMRLLDIAKTALSAHRAAINIVGHNVANAQTPGYVRQRPVLQAIPGAADGSLEGSGIGGGVEIANVQQLRNEFLGMQLDQQTALLGEEESLLEALQRVEGLLTDLGGGGVAGALADFYDAWDDLATMPTSLAARTEVLQRGEVLCDAITKRQENLNSVRGKLDLQLSDKVEQINRLSAEVAQINEKIGAVASVAVKNDLMSQREQAVRELARLCGAEGIKQDRDIMDVVVGGQRLVQQSTVMSLEIALDPAHPGFHTVVFADNGEEIPRYGELAGMLEARDEYIVSYQSRMDELAKAIADEVNTIHQAGYDLDGNTALDFFSYNPAAPASTLQLSADVLDNPKAIAAAATTSAEGDGDNAIAIGDLRYSKVLMGATYTIEEYNADLVSDIGGDVRAVQARFDSRDQLVNNIQLSYEAVSGVSLDEEAIELIRYQQAYSAAARMVTLSLQMLDEIMQLGK